MNSDTTLSEWGGSENLVDQLICTLNAGKLILLHIFKKSWLRKSFTYLLKFLLYEFNLEK